MAAIHERSAAELAAAYSRGELSPVQVARALLERIEAWEPRINAMYRVQRDGALERRAPPRRAGAAAGRCRRSTACRSPSRRTSTRAAIRRRSARAPTRTRRCRRADAPPAARVREAGCVILGKTTMPDFGMLSSGLSSLHGITRNPWRLDRNPSGSSSGAGAAAAAGYAPLHLGTDIGGSVRLPATHCGIFALKPSLGRVPVHPPYMGRVAGPMTRNVGRRRAAHERDRAARRARLHEPAVPATAISPTLEPLEPKGLRIGFLPDMGVGLAVHPEVEAAAEAAATALAGAGCHVESMRSFLTEEMLDGMCRFFEARSYNDLMNLTAGKREKVLPFIAEWCSWRAAQFSGRDVMQAYTPGDGDARGGGRRLAALRLPPLADLADPRLRGRAARAGQRPAQRAAAHRLHRAVQHVRAAGGVDQLELQRATACRSACRSSASASTTPACCGSRGCSSSCAPGSAPGRSSTEQPGAIRPGTACTQRILRLAVSAPNTPATMTQARKKICTCTPGGEAPEQAGGEKAVVEALVHRQRLGRRGLVRRHAEGAPAERLVPEEHLEHQEPEVQRRDQDHRDVRGDREHLLSAARVAAVAPGA